MTRGYVFFLIGALGAPAAPGEFVGVAVVAELHDIVDAYALVAIVVIVRLPDCAERIYGDLVVVAEVEAERFDPTHVEVAAEHEPLPVWLAATVDLVAGLVDDEVFTVRRFQATSVVADVEIQFTVRSEHECVCAVVVIYASDAIEHHLRRAVGLVITVLVGEDQDLW